MAVVTAAYDAARGKLKAIQTLPVMPRPSARRDHLSGSEIIADPTGRFVYISARSVDKTLKNTLVEGYHQCVRRQPQTGKLRPVQQPSSGGFAPRTFVLDPTGTIFLDGQPVVGRRRRPRRWTARPASFTPTGRDLKEVPEPGDFLFEAEKRQVRG